MKRLSYLLLPLVLFLGIAVFLFQGLFSDPRERESTALERPFPEFSLPDLMDETSQYDNSVFDGQLTLINVWGVWCVTCAIELPYLESLRNQGYRIVGLYYDQDLDPNYGTKTIQRVRQEVKQTLGKYGDPYQFNIFDVYRDTALDLGVTGAPETFLVDQNGVIRVHHLGDINERVWQNKFLPIINTIKAATSQDSEEEREVESL
ncbi:DsbE family thiol:disulfide interchange protein [Glaciecola sp. KUL10]|uniref:DsbE family thiol:disulfide interchange protein n=1 Tax=Glaciecola sp. (strain KUL10) TaxID=2161813 RepID=UPI000D789FE0|nr:DsbE family thiol:disulfide interchange protein [Glaciecola sp. KUL10]GBL04199.1 thiol:disulfide interchange protein DsbE [Glaciecola sp. KUL10]